MRARHALGPPLAGAEPAGRVAGVDRPGLEVAEGDRAGAEDGAFADADARADEGVGGDPGVVADGDGAGDELEVAARRPMRAAAELRALGDRWRRRRWSRGPCSSRWRAGRVTLCGPMVRLGGYQTRAVA